MASAVRGLVTGIREHRNLKVQTSVAIVTIAAGIYLDISGLEWRLVLSCYVLVL
jgi:diacylglycerol kinase